ncbi:hypothetical protein DEN90_22890 [Escherichia coli]|nr:hypothetical protein DEN90_22890 [Escherichia coli]TFY34725.1 hypothetical protein DEN89_06875 [Escherichia coli]
MEDLGGGSVLDVYLENTFYLYAVIMLGMVWLTLRAGSNYHNLKNAEKAIIEGRGSCSTEDGPEMIARLKFRALIWYVANSVILLLSAIAFGFLFFLLRS